MSSTPAPAAPGGRDRYFDVLRAACLLWVVVYLCHNPAIDLSYPVGDWLNVWDHGEAFGTVVCFAIAVLLTFAGMLAFGWVEDVAAGRRPQALPTDLRRTDSRP